MIGLENLVEREKSQWQRAKGCVHKADRDCRPPALTRHLPGIQWDSQGRSGRNLTISSEGGVIVRVSRPEGIMDGRMKYERNSAR